MHKFYTIGCFLFLISFGMMHTKNTLSFLPYSVSQHTDTLSLTQRAEAIHEYHLSRTTLNYDSKSLTYQFTIHVFIDDLTTCLEKKGFKKLNIGGKEAVNTDEAIETYLRGNVILMSDKAISYSYLGREFSEDQIALYIYLESAVSPERKSMAIKNSLLLEEFDDQKNIIDITKDKKRVTQILCEKGADYKPFSL